MTKYKVDFEYFVPEFSEIELTADSSDEAADIALLEIQKLYPEAQEIEIVKVTQTELAN
jgi:hypothetical protein